MSDRTETTEAPAAAGGGNKKLIIIVAAVAVLAIGAGVGTTLLLVGGGGEPQAEQAQAEPAAEPAKAAPLKEAIYVNLDPEFVVNFQDSKGKTKFLKAGVNVVTRDEGTSEALMQHMPIVRNTVVLLLSRQIYEDLVPHEGKERLRADALNEIQSVLGKELQTARVEDVLFTSFVMQ